MSSSTMNTHLAQDDEMILAIQMPLPPSVSTLGFYSSDHSEAVTLDDTTNDSSNSLALGRSRGPDQALAPADGGFKAWSFVRSRVLPL